MLAYRNSEEVAALAVETGVPDPPVVEEMPAFLVWNQWRTAWMVALAQVTYPKSLTRLAWLSEITLLLNRTGGVPGVTSVIGLDEVPGLDVGGGGRRECLCGPVFNRYPQLKGSFFLFKNRINYSKNK